MVSALRLAVVASGVVSGCHAFVQPPQPDPPRHWHHHRPISQTRPRVVVGDKLRSQQSSSNNLDTATPNTDHVPMIRSTAAQWHRDRRQQMLHKYGDQLSSLEQHASSQSFGLPLLAFINVMLILLSMVCGRRASLLTTVGLGLFPGSILSLWQLQLLHDNLHGCLLDKQTTHYRLPLPLVGSGINIPKHQLQRWILVWGSMPSAFGYYLYLRFGHLTHHQHVGDPRASNLQRVFDSHQVDFEDGDVLFVAHRMNLLGAIGPTVRLWGNKVLSMSIARWGFGNWWIDTTTTTNQSKPRWIPSLWNATMFAGSFLLERVLLMINDVVVAVLGRNYFFPHKPTAFHRACANYCRVAVAVRALLWYLGGQSWHALLFLYLAETTWSLPPHPAAAMFVTNHGSGVGGNGDDNDGNDNADACIPTSSTYAGRWYSMLTLGTNYHCEHHDFPTIPLHHLGRVRDMAPEFYRHGSDDDWRQILRRAFAQPDYYACMNAGHWYTPTRRKPTSE